MINNLVSVIIPTYNRAHSIKRALDSVKNQNYRPIEVIIVDDFGHDNTEQILKKYDFGTIRYTYIRHEKNMGPGGARNTAMKSASGKYFAFLDSDDEWIRRDKISMQVKFLNQNPEYGLVATAWKIMNVNANSKVLYFTDDASFRKIALKYCPAHTSTWLFRKNIFEKLGGFWHHGAEDYEYLLRIGCHKKCHCMAIVTEKYFNSADGDYQFNISRNFLWTFFVCLKYSFQYPNFISSLLNRFFRLYMKLIESLKKYKVFNI